ncbi:MAG: hypothetical protein ABWY05_07945 [Noviherbaspirillum sp.]
MRRALCFALLCAGLLAAPAQAADAAGGLFSRPVVLRGTLGDAQIQMQLQPKSDPTEGLEGQYIVFGRSGHILLAGETEADGLLMEESENGTDVSGQWEGRHDGAALRGTWQSADGSVSKPFVLTPVDAAPARAGQR